MQSKRVKLLKKYLSKNDRLDICLAQMVKLYKEKPAHPAIQIILKKKLKALVAFKSLILLHNLLHQNAIDHTLCSSILHRMVFDFKQNFDATISQKYLNPYRLFLQKRYKIDLKEQPKTLQERQASIFQLINIIKASQMFQQIIYIFGRYFFKKCKFIIDFNVILAKDVTRLYAAIQEKMPPPHNSAFLKEIQLVHEVMYPIYFNNYFFQHLRTYRPKWINTQNEEEEKKQEKQVYTKNNTFSCCGEFKNITEQGQKQGKEKSAIKNIQITESKGEKKTQTKLPQYKQYLDSTAEGSEQKEDDDIHVRSFDAISEQFEQDTKGEEEIYLVKQFIVDDEEEEKRYKEQHFLKLSSQQIQNFFTQ